MIRETWTHFIQGYYICQSCEVVDRDNNRSIVGYKCPRCSIPSPGGNIYYDITVGAIADLIAGFYPLPDLDSSSSTGPIPDPPESHRLAILVFFCTLGEVLLQQYLERGMIRLGLPLEIQNRLLQDNMFTTKRIQRLFPILTGVPWQEAVKTVSKRAKTDFKKTVDFYIEANGKRNLLLHLGNKWAVPSDMAKQCFDNIAPLIKLFVEFHNTYLVKPI